MARLKPLLPPLLVIVGPTASGKSELAMRIAEENFGEIICSDSRTVYKYADIGTAKPSVADQQQVPHWGLDLVEPNESFSAADFKQYAVKKIKQARGRGHIPILVGGTGLYTDSVIFDYKMTKPKPKLRQKLEAMSLDALKNYCAINNIELPENEKNRRYVIRAIEQKGINNKRLRTPIPNTLVVGITTKPDVLKKRIAARSEQIFEAGVVEEAQKLGTKFGWDSSAMTANVYRLIKRYLDGEFDINELKQRNQTSDWQLAKKQLTWLKRNQFIVWKSLDQAYVYINEQLELLKER